MTARTLEARAMRRTVAAVALSALVLTGCAGTDEPAESGEAPATSMSPSPSDEPTEETTEPSEETSEETSEDAGARSDAIEVEIEGNRVEPNGRRVKVAAGEEIVLEIESDRAAELHVHSSPEQVLKAPRGESTLRLTIDRPGIVDVEEHDSGIVILQLEVR